MNYEELARGLIEALRADESDRNVDGVVKVLESIVGSVNADWEEYITADTNEILTEDNICCECCGTPIKIKRERHVLYVLNS